MKKAKNFLATRKGKVLGVFTLGSFDLTYYYSAIGIVVTAIAIVAAIGLGIRQFKKI
ncbi:hypothetical protein [Campylobacter ureolyticus]|uniref:Uncharacterized protein n=1 Tax=Campylobacter ureolyticus TaxID=827 RepID=A0A9Q4PVE2_9BACT|nr:hypothetical protein [Campylobacter ureolyticus]MCZ6134059.1 hypothetical protein [Campylobacter ureolyticus]MCZ6161799.1 hypothetical protein [Campylobacter ureolyticus]MCZ6170612.1 hypothetical protein [Campylobacter ureolyticus]